VEQPVGDLVAEASRTRPVICFVNVAGVGGSIYSVLPEVQSGMAQPYAPSFYTGGLAPPPTATCIFSRKSLRYWSIELSPTWGQRMIYSRSAEYAIRAFVHLAQVPDGKFAMVRQIAEQEEIPTHFLAKILQQLARKGLLRSSKGPTGGFSLRVAPADICLLNIVEALDGLNEYQTCASGLAECTDEMPCGMHDSWKTLRSSIIEYLERTSIADVAEALQEKRRALEKPKTRRGRRSAGKRKRK
jgi:Rrf2 family protein